MAALTTTKEVANTTPIVDQKALKWVEADRATKPTSTPYVDYYKHEKANRLMASAMKNPLIPFGKKINIFGIGCEILGGRTKELQSGLLKQLQSVGVITGTVASSYRSCMKSLRLKVGKLDWKTVWMVCLVGVKCPKPKTALLYKSPRRFFNPRLRLGLVLGLG
jgi:hypothetical protein